MNRDDCVERDRADPLAALRDQFAIPDDIVYLDGNSLGVLPRATPDRVRRVIEDEWGRGLIGSWNSAGWIDLARRVGDKIGRLIGASPGEVIVADSTSVNLYKVLCAALGAVDTRRTVVLTEAGNFPTDVYIAEQAAAAHNRSLRSVVRADLVGELQARGREVAVVMLTQVSYRTGLVHDMAAMTAAAHAAGAMVVWDLSHSTGAIEVDLRGADADFAIGCGYKYLNGGPGAPAFVWVHPRHVDAVVQPLAGWLGHADPFAFEAQYRPATGIDRFQCGTPPILSLVALECGVDTVLAAEQFGGMAALRARSMALGALFVALVDDIDSLELGSPRDPELRGSQVSLRHASGAYPIMQALIARGVVGDFHAPDVLRFGFAPLYTTFTDVWDAAAHLADVMGTGEWRAPAFAQRAAVT